MFLHIILHFIEHYLAIIKTLYVEHIFTMQ
jgi:hypothetical protein